MLEAKHIVLGVTGGIAAYKSALLTRLLVKAGAAVRIIMTPAAHDFITPVTLSTLSKNPVLTDFTDDKSGQWHNHVELGLWADAFVIAPATANTLGKLAGGLCDNLLLAACLSARCPLFLAPAMDLDMLQHPSTQRNIDTLRRDGCHLLEPAVGELASGLTGKGRMAEPEEIMEALRRFFADGQRLHGKKALVTAGPTREPLDPVRFITNHSTGTMGFALAHALADAGADVALISGPTQKSVAHPRVTLVPVTTAEEMLAACEERFDKSDIAIFSAAVSDYRPAQTATEKIKKGDADMHLALVRNPDIAETLGKRKRNGQLTVGFALETNDEEANALKKLKKKNFDLIVLNSLRDEGAGFGRDTNKVTVLDSVTKTPIPLKPKEEVAKDIVELIIERSHA